MVGLLLGAAGGALIGLAIANGDYGLIIPGVCLTIAGVIHGVETAIRESR